MRSESPTPEPHGEAWRNVWAGAVAAMRKVRRVRKRKRGIEGRSKREMKM